jgi:sigma-E factor negative regulatory protein RseB
VFLEPMNDDGGTDTRTQLGPTVAVSRRLNTPKGKVMVTVVGEIPLGTAERALSMRPRMPRRVSNGALLRAMPSDIRLK